LCAEHSELKKIQVETWGPLVFVHLGEPAESLIDSLGGLIAKTESFPVETFSYARRMTRELACNWKTYVDNYLEGYHVQLLHPSLNRALKMSSYKVSVHDDSYCVHECEPSDGSPVAGAWLFRYPNLAINLYPSGMNVERIMPVGHNRTHVVYDYFAFDTSEDNIAQMVAMSNEILDEDQYICEIVQKNLDSGIYEAGPLSPRHEVGLEWFQSKVKNALPS
jgi:choline monooxygenase